MGWFTDHKGDREVTRIQLLASGDYWTQRKDVDDPMNECQVTSAANWITALKLPTNCPAGTRLPDWINKYAMGEHAQAMAKTENWTRPPRELHDVLAWSINQVCGHSVDVFGTSITIEAIAFDLLRGRPVIVAGTFGPYQHVVCATGIEGRQCAGVASPAQIDLSRVTSFLVADPFGDVHTGYRNEDGSECRFTPDELLQILHSENAPAKWAHRYAGGKAA